MKISVAIGCSIIAACLAHGTASLSAQEYKVGVGRADITPAGPIWLAGYAGRTNVSQSVDLRIFTKALAIEDSTGATTLMVTADTIGCSRWFTETLADRLEKELKIPRERFVFASSHSHSTPVMKGGLVDMYGLNAREQATVDAYGDFFVAQAFEAARMALKNMEPARLFYGHAQAFFAGNRREFGPAGVRFGINPNGLVDNEVPVLRAESKAGKLIAVLFGYACHCTTPGATYEVSGDWAGYAQKYLEENYSGATALFMTGCGADANPNPRGSMLLARQHGLAMAGAVAHALNDPMAKVTQPISVAFERVELPLDKLPGKEYYEEKLKDKAPAVKRYAQRKLEALARGEKLMTSYPCPVQVLRFGKDLTMVALGGEVVVDYAYRLRREMPEERLWTLAYCNDVFAYVPSMRILTEGGYEADANLIYYGIPTRFSPKVEDVLVKKVVELVKKTGGAQP